MSKGLRPGSGDDLCAMLPAPAPALRCVVVVPVRNEAARLPAALAALADQRDAAGRPFDRARFEILLLANNCDDDSAALARRFAAAHPDVRLHVAEATLPPELANIGHVRRSLMDAAGQRLAAADCDNGVIASTDGDSRVADDWLLQTLYALDTGADAVGGRIVTDGCDIPAPPALRLRRLDEAHSLLRSRLASLIDPEPHDPWPRHHQHFGASLAVTARAYRQVGGVPEVPFLEDEALVRALLRHDLRVRHSPQVRVTTSSRLDGRAAVGLSWQLRQWAQHAEQGAPRVESPERWACALVARRTLRTLFHQARRGGGSDIDPAPAAALQPLGLNREQAMLASRELAEARTFGAAWERIEALRSEAATGRDALPLTHAVKALRGLVSCSLPTPRRRGLG